jgi:nitrile hydratase accessory protein
LRRPEDAALAALPEIPRGAEGPVFAEPWQAQAFALAVSLAERGLFTWTEWADRLAAEIRRAQAAGDADRGDTYYHHWLAALEAVIVERGLFTSGQLAERHEAWDRAARATPHGEPIILGRDAR